MVEGSIHDRTGVSIVLESYDIMLHVGAIVVEICVFVLEGSSIALHIGSPGRSFFGRGQYPNKEHQSKEKAYLFHYLDSGLQILI